MRLFVAMLSVLLLACQSGALHAPVFGTWTSQGPRTYRFSDAALAISLTDGGGRELAWEFRNHTNRTLEIRHEELALCLLDQAHQVIGQYTLWGGPVDIAGDLPPIRVMAHQFVAIRYPVLFRSPLVPFERVRDHVELRFFARWGRHVTPYRLTFPSPGESP